ncbi:precorrin-2 dehydrogenase/sirohydrochlorin ferrochelatase family protein [Staphylococcus intermedius]|uniref:precorrin-2 dehydrogenase n=1 Tax=Staphylococcus intermedius NCTC 11048 TaxID=1141106 RepID=A0A380G7A8_STAIN|nr:NAD(P)-dependent oxidoreductase [Staphylococcus intermedius]PCF63847.1 siroheme synthase [Staphylococcus intermedius]PCF78562.1 siroheme synthase [Staphylococcus intermedius]PCF79535.1 siroheme synthase [Staphylococcus intermedius]PCF86729.1 siroheme synthase [Staphylococcus intermedius]PCF89807.1 siroheme synthase [Staphylococcus intermedius]
MYPIQLNLTHKTVTIVGGGNIAWRKFTKLKDEAGQIKIVSPTFNERFLNETRGTHIQLIQKCYERGDLDDADLIITATNDATVNQQVRDDAAPTQWVNHTGDRTQSDFYNSLDIEHQGMKISISSEGQSIQQTKVYAAKIKAFLATLEEDNDE